MLQNAGFTPQQMVFFGKVGRVASEEVIIQLILNNCMPILRLWVDARGLTSKQKSDIRSLDFVVNRFFNEKCFTRITWRSLGHARCSSGSDCSAMVASSSKKLESGEFLRL